MQPEPGLAARLCYDAAEVDGVVAALQAENTKLRAELAAALERADDADRRAAAVGREVALIVQAVLGAAEQSTRPRVEPDVTSRETPHTVDDDYLAELRRALDDPEPLGPRDDEAANFERPEDWLGARRKRRAPVIRAREAWDWGMTLVVVAGFVLSVAPVRGI